MRKVGIAVCTYDRFDSMVRCVNSIRKFITDVKYELIVGIDEYRYGKDLLSINWLKANNIKYFYNSPRLGSIGNQNRCMLELYNMGCDPIIIIEDDNEIIGYNVISELIATIDSLNIEHLALRCPYDFINIFPDQKIVYELQNINGIDMSFSRNETPETIKKYGDWFHVRTEILLVTRKCIDTIGYMDKTLGPFHGPGHPDYTLRARRAGLYINDWYVSPVNTIKKLRYDLCGISNSSPNEIDTGEHKIYRIYDPDRPLYFTYDYGNILSNYLYNTSRSPYLLKREDDKPENYYHAGEIKSYDGEIIYPSQFPWEFSVFLQMYEHIKPKNILEIGSATGGSLYYFINNNLELKTVVNLTFPCDNLNFVSLWESWAKKNDINYIPLLLDSHGNEAIEYVKRCFPEGIDMLFIDGDHSYDGVKQDYETFEKLVNPGGLVVLHDILKHITENYGVFQLWQELVKSGHIVQELYSSFNQVAAGIGIIYK